MTPPQIIAFVTVTFLLSSALGTGLFVLLALGIYGRGVEAGRRLTELAHGWRGDPVLPALRQRWPHWHAPDCKPDDLGRLQFTASWLDEWLTPAGVRRQVFHTNLADFIARDEARGKTVRVVTT
ncbi:hypothetical protein ACIA5D_17845 [Actinoplanes sp. NPDC051513]|uniref:hypothetical protein n=1 Tax=Actinoplanes sp. NPDC051513 TaxID=3363908 RepID=UPI0037B39D19